MEKVDTILAYKNSPKIIQEKDSFSYSIDSTVLSFFCDIKKRCDKIIDFGSGNGIVPLLLSMRTKKPIYGIEIQKSSYDRSLRSISLNGLDGQIKIINDDIKNVRNLFEASSFSLVTSNPPYFKKAVVHGAPVLVLPVRPNTGIERYCYSASIYYL